MIGEPPDGGVRRQSHHLDRGKLCQNARQLRLEKSDLAGDIGLDPSDSRRLAEVPERLEMTLEGVVTGLLVVADLHIVELGGEFLDRLLVRVRLRALRVPAAPARRYDPPEMLRVRATC